MGDIQTGSNGGDKINMNAIADRVQVMQDAAKMIYTISGPGVASCEGAEAHEQGDPESGFSNRESAKMRETCFPFVAE